MSDIKKHIIFMHTNHTAASTVALMKRLLKIFPKNNHASM